MYDVRNKPQYGVRDTNTYIRPDDFGITMPIPLAGIDKSLTGRDIKVANVSDADNAWISDDGFLEMMGGYKAFSEVLGSRNLLFTEFILDPDTKKMVYAYGNDTEGVFGTLDSVGVFTSLLGKTHKTGTATAGGATTLTDSTATFTVDLYKGYKVEITAGTGIGQIRTIVSNTATVLTVATWTTNPNSTSVYKIYSEIDKDEKFGYVSYINSRGAEILGDTTVTSATANTITVAGATWRVDQYKGKIVKLISGTGAGQYRQVLKNISNVLTIKDIDFETIPTSSTHFKILSLGNSLYFKQEDSNLYEYDGTNIYIHTDKPEGNALYIWQERMVIGGADDMVDQWSKPLDVTNFTGDGSFYGNIGSENGQRITAHLELPQNRLVVFKEDSYQIINGLEGTVDEPIVNSESISQSVGCCGIRAITEVPDMGAIVVSSDKKIYPFGYLQNVLSGIVGEGNTISDKVKRLLEIDDDTFDDVFVSYDKLQNKIWFSFQVNSIVRVLIFDFERKALNPFWYSSDMNIEQVLNFDGKTYMTLAGTGRIVEYTPTVYTRLGADFESTVTFKEFSGKQLNPKLFNEIIFSLKNTVGSFLCKARISDSSDMHQLAENIPMGEVDLGGGVGGSPSGFIASGGYETVYDIENSQFIKRRFNLDETVGISLACQITSSDFFSFGEFSITGENLSEDEEDINIQY